MLEVVRTSRPVSVDENDLVSLADAARLSGRSITAVAALMERGSIPWYQLRAPAAKVEGERVQRFTSRRAVEALPKRAAGRSSGKSRRKG